jgi:hypothetical protein
MKNSLKGALLSGLVFPGCGQYTLKHYIRGIALALTSLAGLIVIGVNAYRQAVTFLEKIDLKNGAADMTDVLNAVSQADTASGAAIYKYVSILLMICWTIGVIDAYMIGRKKDIRLSQE